jgi:hypothetical protein
MKSAHDELTVAERLLLGALITTANVLLALLDLNRAKNAHESLTRDRWRRRNRSSDHGCG